MFSSILALLFFVAPSGQFLNQIDGFLEPSHAIWLPNGNIAVADRLADEIIILSPDGERISVVHAEGVEAIKWSEDGLVHPIDPCASLPWETNEIRRQGIPSSTTKEWLFPDLLGHSIHHYDQEGNWIGKWGVHALLPHEGEGKIHYPNAVDVSPDGKQVIVCEGFEGRIQIFALGEGEPEPAPVISNIAHFGKQIDSYSDLILIAEPELGDIYLFRTGLDVPIQLTRFGGEGNAPHHFKWVNGLWIGDGQIKVVGEGNLKTFVYEHDSDEPLKMQPGMVKFQRSQNHESFVGPIDNLNTMPSAADIAVTDDGLRMWVVNAEEETVSRILLSDYSNELTIDGFVEPSGIEIESDGSILVSDIGASNIKRFSKDGQLLLTFGEKGYAPHQMFKPAGITVLDDGTIVIVDWGNHRAQLYSPDGAWKATFGKGRSWTRDKNPPPHTITSNAGKWKVTFSPSPAEMPLNEIFELTTRVQGDGKVKSLRVDAAMPEHGHGMMTDPVTTLQDDGSYKTTGMLLSMPGYWELYFDVDDGSIIERAQDEVTLDP